MNATTLARDIMTRNPVCVRAATTVRELAAMLDDRGVSGAPVVNDSGRLIGVVSRTDLVRRCSAGEPAANRPPAHLLQIVFDPKAQAAAGADTLIVVQDFMNTSPVTAPPTAPVAEVARLMRTHRVHRVVITDEAATPVGIVTTLDVMKVFG